MKITNVLIYMGQSNGVINKKRIKFHTWSLTSPCTPERKLGFTILWWRAEENLLTLIALLVIGLVWGYRGGRVLSLRLLVQRHHRDHRAPCRTLQQHGLYQSNTRAEHQERATSFPHRVWLTSERTRRRPAVAKCEAVLNGAQRTAQRTTAPPMAK